MERICNTCGIAKPFPAEYVTSYKRGTTGPKCAACRIERSKYLKNKHRGGEATAPTRGWKDTMKTFITSCTRKK